MISSWIKSLELLDKVAFVIFGILIFLILISCKKEPIILEGCLEEPYPNMVCTMEVNYQCGCDGWVYINPCYATKNGVTKIRPYDIDEPGDNCNPW